MQLAQELTHALPYRPGSGLRIEQRTVNRLIVFVCVTSPPVIADALPFSLGAISICTLLYTNLVLIIFRGYVCVCVGGDYGLAGVYLSYPADVDQWP